MTILHNNVVAPYATEAKTACTCAAPGQEVLVPCVTVGAVQVEFS